MKLLTFLICTRNGASTLVDCLAHIARQKNISHDAYEVVIVDNGSVDDTAAVARSALAALKCATKYVVEPKEGKVNAFLRGVRLSEAQFIAVVDDDNLLGEEFAFRTLQLFSEFEELGMVGSSNVIDGRAIPDWFPIAAGRFGCAEPYMHGDVKKIGDDRVISSRAVIAGAGSTFRRGPLLRALDLDFSFSNDTFRGRRMAVTGEDIELCYLFQWLGYWFGFDRRITLQHRINPSRLTWPYARRLARSIGAGTPVYDAFLWLESNDSTSRNGTWWWLAARRIRRLMNALPKFAFSGKEPSRVILNWDAELGGLIRLCRERGAFTRRIQAMKSSRWAQQLRNSRVQMGQ